MIRAFLTLNPPPASIFHKSTIEKKFVPCVGANFARVNKPGWRMPETAQISRTRLRLIPTANLARSTLDACAGHVRRQRSRFASVIKTWLGADASVSQTAASCHNPSGRSSCPFDMASLVLFIR